MDNSENKPRRQMRKITDTLADSDQLGLGDIQEQVPPTSLESNDAPAPSAQHHNTPPEEDQSEKSKLSMVEKLTLGFLTLILIALAAWGYLFLYEKNKLIDAHKRLELPVKGEFAVVSEFKTFWRSSEGLSGIKFGALLIPSVSITLSDDNSHSGTFRVYFQDSNQRTVGDPITTVFNNGQFSNGKSTTEITATNGFHREGAFNEYLLDESVIWTVRIMEAQDENASSEEFKPFLKTSIRPIRRKVSP